MRPLRALIIFVLSSVTASTLREINGIESRSKENNFMILIR